MERRRPLEDAVANKLDALGQIHDLYDDLGTKELGVLKRLEIGFDYVKIAEHMEIPKESVWQAVTRIKRKARKRGR